MKYWLVVSLVCFSLQVQAQMLKERRVYYLDCSYSMVKPNGIWDEVRNNLKNAIDKVSDETTELMLIPFAFDKSHHSSLEAFSAMATSSGKAMLKKKIDELETNKSTMTFHSDPLKDFYTKRVDPSRITYMFFMTDGQNEENPDLFIPLLEKWGGLYGTKNVYGFYVMLDRSAKDKHVEDVIAAQPQLWKVETADVNINLVRFQTYAVFNARQEKYFDIPLYGKSKGMSFEVQFLDPSPYRVLRTSLENGKLRVYITYSVDVYSLPYSADYEVGITMSGGGEYDFLVTETIRVKCVSKPERSLKISVR